jgi:threonine aldolase
MSYQIDLRSDTVTKPTEEMRYAMANAEVGDDVYGEDPTVNRLEKIAAEMVGKEAALFVPSGTMGNQIAIMAHTKRGDEVILESEAHIYYYEVGGIAVLSGAHPRQVPGKNGILEAEDIAKELRVKNIHFPETRLICLENTHNRGGGTITPINNMKGIKDLADSKGIFVHLDGARVFNAAVALGVDVKEITAHVDTVMFCLSKGLCAPVGSMVAGPKDWIEKAKKWRKMLGGGMRQSGILAAAGIISLTKMVERLAEDHQNAKILANGLAKIEGIVIDLETVQTNIVAFDIAGTKLTVPEFLGHIKESGILAGAVDQTRIRMVTHHGISSDDIAKTLNAIEAIA